MPSRRLRWIARRFLSLCQGLKQRILVGDARLNGGVEEPSRKDSGGGVEGGGTSSRRWSSRLACMDITMSTNNHQDVVVVFKCGDLLCNHNSSLDVESKKTCINIYLFLIVEIVLCTSHVISSCYHDSSLDINSYSVRAG